MDLLQLGGQGDEGLMQSLDKGEDFRGGVTHGLLQGWQVTLQRLNLLPVGQHASLKLLHQLLKIPVQSQGGRLYMFINPSPAENALSWRMQAFSVPAGKNTHTFLKNIYDFVIFVFFFFTALFLSPAIALI